MNAQIIFEWIAAGRRTEARCDERSWVIEGTRRGFVVPGTCLAGALLFLFMVTQHPQVARRDQLILLAIGTTAALACAVWTREHYLHWMRIDDDGLSERRFMNLGAPRHVPWDGLELGTSWGMAVTLTHPSGGSIQLARDAPLDGLGTLLKLLAERLPHQRGEVIAAAEILGFPAPAADPAEDWIDGVPRLYPDLRGVTLESLLAPAAANKLMNLPRVMVHPFMDPTADPRSRMAGVALSRVVVRNLMLLRDVSVRGPEDTPTFSLAQAEAGEPTQGQADVHVVGSLRLDGDGLVVKIALTRADAARWSKEIEGAADSLHVACAHELAGALGVNVDDRTTRRWRALRPTVADLVQHGRVVLEGGDALEAFRRAPDYPTVLHDVDAGQRSPLMHAIERDPFDAQLCFQAFLAVWTGTGAQDCALQFARKAIELSPGHGKAHMVFPHASRSRTTLLHHSKVAHALLPGNVFAVTNLINYLREAGKTGHDVLPLAEEAVSLDPENPRARHLAIDAHREVGAFDRALEHAEALARLYGPPIHPRTLYCLRQSPSMEDALRRGELDLPKEARELIDELRTAARANRQAGDEASRLEAQ